MKNVNVYYTTIKPSGDTPNYRAYFINRWIGKPFLKFELSSKFGIEREKIATHLGLTVEQINWHKHRGSKKTRTK